jgi:hypothetical protein
VLRKQINTAHFRRIYEHHSGFEPGSSVPPADAMAKANVMYSLSIVIINRENFLLENAGCVFFEGRIFCLINFS